VKSDAANTAASPAVHTTRSPEPESNFSVLNACLKDAAYTVKAGRYDDGRAHYPFGICYESAHDYPDAIKEFETGLNLMKDDRERYRDMADLVLHLSVALAKTGRTPEATRLWKSLYQYSMRTNSAYAAHGSALTDIERGGYRPAFRTFYDELAPYQSWPMGFYSDQAQQLAPQVYTALKLGSNGRYADAVSTLQGVTRALPQFQEAQFYLGVALLARGQREDARMAWFECLLNPRSRSPGTTAPDVMQVDALRLLIDTSKGTG
jgi:tetratricopeptide (TPR) repeat protein